MPENLDMAAEAPPKPLSKTPELPART